jgi:O-antigen ligase
LYVAGPAFSERALARLISYGYPAGRIVRYIEDDPARPMRAIGTSVDPNSFGGLCMIGFVLAVGQLLALRPVVSRPITGGAMLLTVVPLLLTYSRGAWVGAAAGAGLVVLLRRPRWAPGLLAVATAGLAAGVGRQFVQRLWLGFTLQDPATRLRLSEYRNAWRIIQAHPWFGVGFGDAPRIDLQTGVSSIYFTLAEQAGLLGLSAFLATCTLVLWRAARMDHRGADDERIELLVTFGAAFVAALTVGLVDHYFVNPRFPHMVALFWIVAGVLVALAQPGPALCNLRASAYAAWRGSRSQAPAESPGRSGRAGRHGQQT